MCSKVIVKGRILIQRNRNINADLYTQSVKGEKKQWKINFIRKIVCSVYEKKIFEEGKISGINAPQKLSCFWLTMQYVT